MAEKVLTTDEFYKKLSKEDKEAIIDLQKVKSFEFIPSGSWVINAMIGDGSNTNKPGGFPRGHIVEIFGSESSGKTTLALSACRQVQQLGGLAVFVDFEQTFHKQYAENIGVDTSKSKFLLMEPRNFEHGASLIKNSLAMRPWIIVVDSVSAMLPKSFLEGSIDDVGRIGLQAQLMSGALSYITKFLKSSNTCLLFTNQLRSVIKKSKYDPGPIEESSGGRALKFYSSVRIKLRSSGYDTINVRSAITGKTEKKAVNVTVKATVIKNKIDRPFMSSPVYIRFGEGFDNILSVIELAINNKIIEKAGPFFKFEKDGKTVFNAQGKEQIRTILKENNQAFELLKGSIKFKQDEQAAAEYKDNEDPDVEVEETDEMGNLLTNITEGFKKTTKEDEKSTESSDDA